MGRRGVQPEERQRAVRLAASLEQRKSERDISIQDLSAQSGVRYETVRALLSGRSAGPSFFLVADLAIALGATLDDLAQESR